ncbi:MAG: hypothetical protein K9G76_06245 [Bacteroidales bacterium]|nr:hypothetical protein [Bacteroidales bacterium]MCF8402371.1 hypothetical protein [Bacteroidales bacterium]
MKKTLLVLIALILISSGNTDINRARAGTNPQDNSINILSTPDLYDLTNKLSDEYCKTHPDFNVQVIQVSEKQIPEIFSAGNGIGFISKKYIQGIKPETLWHLLIGREVIVPVINENNPFASQLDEKGVIPEDFNKLFTYPDKKSWGTLLKNNEKSLVHFYTVNDPSVKAAMAEFLKIEEQSLKGISLDNIPSMISAIQNDPLAIGFCRITDIVNGQDQSLISNIKLLPIDKNGNGTIDYFEDIYDDLLTFLRGVWIGKFPNSLARNIYSISATKPTHINEVNFLKWVLTDGQYLMQSNGISELAYGERQLKLDKLRQDEIFLSESTDNYATLGLILFIFIGVITLGFITAYAIRHRKYGKVNLLKSNKIPLSVINENSIQIPKGLFFDKSHTWAFMEKEGKVRIGIDDFLQHVTGPITRIKMKNPGDTIKKGEAVLTLIQNGKQLTVRTPVSGIIREINEDLITNSQKMNNSPYTEGWVYMIEPSNWLREIQFLAMANKYKDWLKNEFHRLKDFIAASGNINSLAQKPLILQDGGEIKDNILKDFRPEVWEDFQKHFLDTSELR